MDQTDITYYVVTFGAAFAAIWALISKVITPAIIKAWGDRREHQQEIETAETKLHQLESLVALGSRTYTEEQLTQAFAETQAQLGESNHYIRHNIDMRLNDLERKQDDILLKISLIVAYFTADYDQRKQKNNNPSQEEH